MRSDTELLLFFFLPQKPLCCSSVAQSCPAPHGLKHARIPSTVSQSLLRLVSIESVMPSNHLILRCHILLLPLICPSFRVFSIKSALCIRWPEYWSFSISPCSEYSGLISFRLDWFDLLAVQGLSRFFSNTTVQFGIYKFHVLVCEGCCNRVPQTR